MMAVVTALSLLAVAPAGAARGSGTISSFGAPADGRLGRTGGSSAAPVAVAGRFVALAGGDAHSMAVRDDGTLWTWGDNQWGQLGNGTSGPLAPDGAPAQVVTVPSVVGVAAGGRHSLAIRPDGTVVSWGDNTRGQLGRGVPLLDGVPAAVLGLPAGDPVVEVAAGASHSLVRTADGIVYAWGDNFSGQVGPTPLAGTVAFAPVVDRPVRVVFPDPVEIVDVAAGSTHSLAVDRDGRVWAWGANGSGQLGRAAGSSQPLPAAVAVDGNPLVDVVQADGGASTTTIRRVDGRVSRFGDGNTTPIDVALPGPALDIVASGRHVLATVDESDDDRAASSVFEWGEAEEFGGPGTFWTATPTRRGTSATTVAIGVGRAHGLMAEAPRVVVSDASLDFGAAYGPVEVFGTTQALSVQVTNQGPGAAVVSAVDIDSLDFEVAGHDCSTLAAGASCSVDVAFSPTQIGLRAGALRIEHDGFDPDFVIDLAGEATEIRGQIYVTTDLENLTVGVPASPRSIPLAAIPVQVNSPQSRDSEGIGFRLPLGDIEGIGFRLPLGDIEGIGFRLPLGDIEGIGFRLPLGDIEGIGFRLPLGDIEGIGFRLPLGDIEGISSSSAVVLEQVTLDRLPLRAPYRWDDAHVADDDHPDAVYDGSGYAVLTGSPELHDQPLQSISLADVLRDAEAADRFKNIPTPAVDLGQSIFAAIGIDALLLGDIPLADLGRSDDWCGQLETAGFANCGAGLGRPGAEGDGRSASAFEHQMSGVPLGALNLAPVTIGDLGGLRVPANQMFLDQMPLYESDLGSIRLADVDDVALVADCSATDCASATVHQALLDGALLPAAQVGDLAPAADHVTMARLLYGLVPAAKLPFGATSLDDLFVKYYGDPAVSSIVPFEIHFQNGDTVLPAAARISAVLPPSFAYVPGSAVLELDGQEHPVEASVAEDQRTLSWPIPPRVGPGKALTLRFEARPGLTTGVFTIDEVAMIGTGGGGITSESAGAPVQVIDAERFGEDDGELESARPIEPSVLGVAGGSMAIGHLSSSDDVDLYSFEVADVPAGSEILVELSHQRSGDGDVVLYGPADQAGTAPLRTPEDVPPLTLTVASDSGFDRSAGVVESDAILRERSIIDSLPVLGVSQQRDVTDERLVAVAPAGGTGTYTVAVVPYDGEFSDDPYSLRVTITPPLALPSQTARPTVSSPVAPASGPVVLSGNPSGAETLFLTAPSRLADDPSVDLIGTLLRPSLNTLVGPAAVLAVDRDPGVAAAFAAWDAEPADPARANDVVRSINHLVDGLRGPTLEHLVLVGGDDILPMARVADLTSFISERAFAAESAAITVAGAADSVTAAAAANQILVDDAYGDFAPTPIVGFQYLFVTDVGLGRLLETEAEIVGLLDQFDRFDGVLAPTAAVSTSSVDFLDDAARSIAARLDARLDVTTLVDEADWGADGPARLGEAIAASDVIAVNGHSDPLRTETRSTSGTDAFTSVDLVSAGVRDGAVVVAAGCHLLLPYADSVVRAGVPSEFVQAGGAAGAASLVGNTGYGIGSRSTVAYTEALLTEYSAVLGTFDQGGAIRAAKRSYVAGQGSLDAFDLKVVQELTHFGMPQLRYAGSSDPAAPAPLVASAPATANVDLSFVADRISTGDGDYFVNPASAPGYVSAPGLPVVPSTTLTVGPVGSEVVGFMIDGARSFEAPGDAAGEFFDPVLDVVAPTGSTASSRSEPSPSDVQFPANLWASQGNALRLATGLFRSVGFDAGGDTVGSMTVFEAMRGRAYVAPQGSRAGDSPPQLLQGRALTDQGSTTFVAEVTDDVGVAEVGVLYREIDAGVGARDWRSVTLAPDGAGLWTGGAAVAAETVETIFQVRDTANQVTWLTNKARLTPAVPLDPGPFGPVSIAVSGEPAASNPDAAAGGWWRHADVTLQSDVPITARVGKGEPFLVTGDDPQLSDLPEGYHLISVRAADGSGGTFVVKVDRSQPEIDVFDGNFVGRFLLNEVVSTAITCRDAVSGVESCVASVRTPDGSKVSVASGEALPTDQPGVYVVSVEAVDVAGNETRTLRLYVAQYVFEGFLPPLTNLPKANSFKAGDVAPMLWRFSDANGATVSDLDVIWAAGSVGYPCGWTDAVAASGDGSSATGISHDGDRYRFGWKTDRSHRNECRSFVFVFDDASIRAIAFEFR